MYFDQTYLVLRRVWNPIDFQGHRSIRIWNPIDFQGHRSKVKVTVSIFLGEGIHHALRCPCIVIFLLFYCFLTVLNDLAVQSLDFWAYPMKDIPKTVVRTKFDIYVLIVANEGFFYAFRDI